MTQAQKPAVVRDTIDCAPKGTVGYAQLDFRNAIGKFSVYCTKNDPLAPPWDNTHHTVPSPIPSGTDHLFVAFSIYKNFVDQNTFDEHEICTGNINGIPGTLGCSGTTSLSATVKVW